jgi:hypothetical protein
LLDLVYAIWNAQIKSYYHLRNIASDLNSDLHCHFLRDNATCNTCGYNIGNLQVLHIFFECLQFSEQRRNLFEYLNALQFQYPSNCYSREIIILILKIINVFKNASFKVKGFNNTVEICNCNALFYFLAVFVLALNRYSSPFLSIIFCYFSTFVSLNLQCIIPIVS